MVRLHPPEKVSIRFDEDVQPNQVEDVTVTNNDSEIPVNFLQLFRFATTKDYSILILSILAALGTGPCLSIAVVLFGDLANIFVINAGDASFQNVSQLVCLNSSLYNENPSKGRLLQSNGDNIMDDVVNYAIGTGLVGISSVVFNLIFVTGFSIAAQNQIYRLRSHFFAAILKQEIAWYDTRTSDGFAARISEDLNKIHDGIGEKVGLFLSNLSLSVSCFITAFYYGWELSLIMLASLPILSIVTGVLAKIQASLAAREVESYAVAGGLAEEVICHIKTVTVYGTQSKEAERFATSLKPAVHAGIQRGLATAIGSGLVWLLTYSSYALAFWYGIGLVLDVCSGYDAGSLNIVFFNALYSALKLGQLLPYIQSFSVARSAAAGVYRIIDRNPIIDSSSRQGKRLDHIEGHVRFEGVDFSYPSRVEVPILNTLTLDVPAGRTVALVGSSGCGKSTCIQLLQRFYDPIRGRVLIDGQDLKELNVRWLRDQIGVVGQEPSLFDMSIAENIKYGARQDGQEITQEDIERAARKANADGFIRSLPKGYDTLVGERGTQLSGGQKQRIAIARAIVRDPKILLLDEATSALDTQSELVVQKALDKARKGRTTLIVAHRLSTIRNSDLIFVFNQGKVEEQGKHQELMEARGIYHHLVMSQEQNDTETTSNHDDNHSIMTEDNIIINVKETNESPANSSIKTETEELKQSQTSTTAAGVSIWMILRLTKKTEWFYNLLGLLGATLMGISTPIYAVVFGEVMGLLALDNDDNVQTQRNFFTYMFLVIAVGAGLGAFLQTFAFSVAGERLTFRLRTLSFEAILRKNIGWFDLQENSIGALCARLSNDASAVQGATGARIGFLLQVSISIIFAVSLSLFYEWKLALSSAVFVPIVLLAAILETKIGMGQNDNKALETSSKIASEALSSIRTVASLGKEDAFHASYMRSLLLSFKQCRRRSPIRGLIFGIANNVTTFASIVCMSYGGYLIQNEDLDYKNVFIIGEALIFGMEMIGQTLAFTPNFGKARIAALRIFELLDDKNDSKDDPQSSFPDFVEGKIEFDNVTFTYPTRPNISILNGLSVVMLPSKTVAIVGPSGCGKSTVIQLIQRFYDPKSGSIKLDNHPFNSMSQDSLRRNIGIVSQEPALFNRTLAENIAYGTDNYRPVTTAEIIEAARKSNIHTFIQSLPMGYETKVGQRGTQLSGGQKQRVAIARALVRNPKILLLDEATSALDAESEKVVQEALNVASQGRTCISIAHRLSTIQRADLILVVNQGRVMEQGKHDDLIQLKGMYHQLWTVQGISNKQ